MYTEAIGGNETTLVKPTTKRDDLRGAVFTARCTIVQSEVLRSHVLCMSVCDVGGS